MTYVAPRIIVHGFPATGLEHMYRNPRYEIRRFMDDHHHDHYKVYNFCCEYGRGYDPSVFHGRVERYPFKDHNTPPLETMAAFANSVKAWLDADPENVANLHCKAGKGRAGLMCCVAMIRTGVAQSAQEALEIYDRERVTNLKGLTVTSQRKFVIFYEQMWREMWGVKGNIGDIPAEPLGSDKYPIPAQPALRLFGIEVVNLPVDMLTQFRITIFKISNFLPVKVYDSANVQNTSVSVDLDVILQGNFKIHILYKKGALGSKIKLMELLHNTYFMDRYAGTVDFDVTQLDIKKKVKPKLGTNIMMRLKFTQDGTEAVGTKGYEVLAAGDDAGDDGVLGDDGTGSHIPASGSYNAVARDEQVVEMVALSSTQGEQEDQKDHDTGETTATGAAAHEATHYSNELADHSDSTAAADTSNATSDGAEATVCSLT